MSDVNKILTMLRLRGVTITADSRILDLGCGEGSSVYELMDLGYPDAYGHDVENRVVLRNPQDQEHFRFSAPGEKWPFPDNYFDIIYSETVLEHVQDHAALFHELKRVLKDGGISIHTFPSKWVFIEPHINVPLGSIFQSRGYFKFWARMGIRNCFQQDCTPDEVADLNTRYAESALNYLSQSEYEAQIRPIFGNCFSWDELLYWWSLQWDSTNRTRWKHWNLSSLRKGLYSEVMCDIFPPCLALVRALDMRTLVLWKGDVICRFKTVRAQPEFRSVHPR